MTDVFNLFDGELDDERDRPGWSWQRAIVGDKIGAKVGIWTGNEADPPRLFRIESAVDYWDGETA